MVLWVVPACWCGSFDDEFERLKSRLPDAGVVDDAGVDAAVDAGVDAGVDASVDAGADAGAAAPDAGDGGEFDAGACHGEGESCPCCAMYCCGLFGTTTHCQFEVTATVPCID